MWNSGSEVISRSAAVSPIQYGNPSPASTYARCVCMTSLDRPVVPEVGMSTARSSGLTPASGSGPAGPPLSGQSPASSVASSTPSGGDSVSSAAWTRSASPWSVMSARGWVCRASPASSAGALRGLTDTTTAPSAVSASQQIRYSGVVRAVTMTRSPCPTPVSRRLAAAAATRPSAPAKLSVPASLRTQTPSGSRAAASASTCGMVRDGGRSGPAGAPAPAGAVRMASRLRGRASCGAG